MAFREEVALLVLMDGGQTAGRGCSTELGTVSLLRVHPLAVGLCPLAKAADLQSVIQGAGNTGLWEVSRNLLQELLERSRDTPALPPMCQPFPWEEE